MKLKYFGKFLCATLIFSQCVGTQGMCATPSTEITVNENEEVGYSYAITPVDEEWSDLESHQEMLDEIQLSDEFLETASTEELFDAVLDYPLLIDITFYDDAQTGIEEVAEQFNGLKELLEREDLSDVVKEKYYDAEVPMTERVDYEKVSENLDLLDTSKKIRKNVYLDLQDYMEIYFEETVLSLPDVSSQYSTKEKKKILNEVVNKTEDKENSVVYNYEKTSNFFTALSENSTEENAWNNIVTVQSSVKTSSVKGSSTSTVYVKTPNGTKISCICYSNNTLNSASFAAQQKAAYPKATLVGNGYTGNNCHAYAWTGRQDIWMNNPSSYVSDGSYVKISKPTANGQKAVWGSYVHSAIVMDYTKSDPTVTSKWGSACIMRCAASYCPYNGTIKYYKRNS